MNSAKENKPEVFIGVPVYNGGEYLKECLQSILDQTYQHWECAIIDNQSKDDTNRIATEFAEKDNRFKLFVNEEFVDQTTNWNISYSKMPGSAKYFKIVCADDWLFPEYLEKMVPLMEKRPDAGFCSSYRIDGNRVRCDGLDYYEGNYFDGKNVLIRQLYNNLDITGSVNTLLFRVETLKKLDYHPEIFRPDVYHIDTVLAFDVLNISNVAFVFQVLSYTRRHNETYTSLISNRYKTSLYLLEMEIRKFLGLDPKLHRLHRTIRMDYAWFLFMKRVKNDKECIAWHRKFSTANLRFSEYFAAVLTRNLFSRQLRKIL
jgi:glycosyltransferase involved in cell wall biosynthesis